MICQGCILRNNGASHVPHSKVMEKSKEMRRAQIEKQRVYTIVSCLQTIEANVPRLSPLARAPPLVDCQERLASFSPAKTC